VNSEKVTASKQESAANRSSEKVIVFKEADSGNLNDNATVYKEV
jgi:hypothetical protein